ncbi:lactonase family protein [Tunturiibacter gelidoferens]|uniref:YVTN family beta-propeller protein n=1 Tax=Tunturiibacter gelidiferens TaxID=3069689 RepID=A0A9X0QJ73_9BACT|nr:beta-propeller fold lactonase family protein [Edaphobacter lichenicola]MBB5331249.1 YVTN family beta-propeller protein [Edaphobacter lichenicola]
MPTPHRSSFRLPVVATFAILLGLSGCHRSRFPDVPAGYREYAYVSNAGSNTVTVLDLVYLRQDHTLQVGTNPTNMAVNPTRNEVYVANAQSGTISVINADANRVVATIAVRHRPSFIAVEPSGHRAYVANYGSNSVSIVDLDLRREVSVAGAGEQPVQVHISPDGRTLVVTNHGSNSVSVFDVIPYSAGSPASASVTHLRSTFSGCPGAGDTVILPDSSKAFVACSAGHQVMALSLAAAPGSWAAKQNPSLTTDRMLALLDVGKMPVHLAMKPDGGEIFVSNFDSDSFSEIATWTNEVGGTYSIGNKPVRGIVSRDNSTLWVANSGADSIGLYSIDDGKLAGSVRTGSGPDALAFSEDEHLLLAADTHSGDIAVIRTEGKQGPALFTILPAGISPNDIVVKALHEK